MTRATTLSTKNRDSSVSLLCDHVPSPLGVLVIVARDGRICASDFDDCHVRMMATIESRYGLAELRRVSDPYGISTRIRAYFAGDLEAINTVAVDTGGTPFQQQVWKALRSIPAGMTVTYTELARRLGRPTAVRAVGTINGRNPLAIVVPCHRVVGADGSLVGYAGGLWRKHWLLVHEGARASLATGRSTGIA